MTINGVKYEAPELTLGVACEIEKLGCQFDHAGEQPINFMVCYCAVIMGVSVQETTEAIDAHLKTYGNVDDILAEVTQIVDRSPLQKKLTQNSGIKKFFK